MLRVRVLNPDDSLAASTATGATRVTVGSGPRDLVLHATFTSLHDMCAVRPHGPLFWNGQDIAENTIMRREDEVAIGRWRLVVDHATRSRQGTTRMVPFMLSSWFRHE